MNTLPTGRRGQALAVGLTLLAAAVIWLGAVAPAVAWYQGRAEHLDQQQTLAARMESLAATVPALQQQLAQASQAPPPARALLEGATDAIASAALQQAVQDMAARAGATVTSAEVLPAEAVGAYRRVGLHVTVAGGWPVIVGLMTALAEATPRMLVDDLSVRPSLGLGKPDKNPLDAAFTVIGFHTGPAAPPGLPAR